MSWTNPIAQTQKTIGMGIIRPLFSNGRLFIQKISRIGGFELFNVLELS